MSVGYTSFTRSTLGSRAAELGRVDELPAARDDLERSAADINAVHVHGAQSGDVQSIVAGCFGRTRIRGGDPVRDEIGLTTQVRPDFIFHLESGRGILAEVERGGTTTNNHDLKDFWKTHIAPDAQHLFLVVPPANWSADGPARETPFLRVSAPLRVLR